MTIASQKFKVCKGLDMEDKQRPIILFGKGCFNIFSKKIWFRNLLLCGVLNVFDLCYF